MSKSCFFTMVVSRSLRDFFMDKGDGVSGPFQKKDHKLAEIVNLWP